MAATIDPATTPASKGGSTQAMLVEDTHRWLYISGQVPVDREGNVPSTFEDQCRLVWHNVTETLRAARMEVRDLVKVTTYLSDRRYADLNSAIRHEVLGSHRPALTVVLAGIFDESWLLEVEAVATARPADHPT